MRQEVNQKRPPTTDNDTSDTRKGLLEWAICHTPDSSHSDPWPILCHNCLINPCGFRAISGLRGPALAASRPRRCFHLEAKGQLPPWRFQFSWFGVGRGQLQFQRGPGIQTPSPSIRLPQRRKLKGWQQPSKTARQSCTAVSELGNQRLGRPGFHPSKA